MTVTNRARIGFLAGKLGEQLAARRKELAITQEQLAAAAFTTQALISRLEAGHLPRDSRALDRCVVALGGEGDLWDGLGLFRITRHCAEVEARNDDNDDAQGATR